MKIKWNWGTGIVVAMALFMIFILQFVYRVTFLDKYDHHLVSEDYYTDELYYQKEIDKLNNASKLTNNVTIKNFEKGIMIHFPEDKDFNKIEGTINFQRPSNSKIDFKKDIDLKGYNLHIPDSLLASGKWNVRIDWQFNDEKYLLKESIFY